MQLLPLLLTCWDSCVGRVFIVTRSRDRILKEESNEPIDPIINLSGADLKGAELGIADLREANLTDAKGWTNEQLAQAESLVGARMPDGQIMTEQAWEEFKKSYQPGS